MAWLSNDGIAIEKATPAAAISATSSGARDPRKARLIEKGSALSADEISTMVASGRGDRERVLGRVLAAKFLEASSAT